MEKQVYECRKKGPVSHKDLPADIQSSLTQAQKAAVDHAMRQGIGFLITGEQGPTGKTTLKEALRALGFCAYEPHDLQEVELSGVKDEQTP